MNKLKLNLISACIISAFMLLQTACKKEKFITPSSVDMYTAIKNDVGNFSFLAAAINRAGLKDQLSGSGDFTLFAPVNQAFIDAGYTNIAAVNAADSAKLAAILKYHLVQGKVDVKQINARKELPTLNGGVLILNTASYINSSTKAPYTVYYANGADILGTNVNVANGNMQVINSLLSPASNNLLTSITSNTNYSLFAAATTRASQGSTNFVQLLTSGGPYTVFVPNNSAMNNYSSGKYNSVAKINAADPNMLANEIVGYHIINNSSFGYELPPAPTTLNGQKLIISNVRTGTGFTNTNGGTTTLVNGISFGRFPANKLATNGIINEISTVLPAPSTLTILQTIQANTNFTYLVAAINQANQSGVNFTALLSGTDSYTLFAPTNAAFIAAGYPTVASVTAEVPTTLAGILNTHIFAGSIYSVSIALDTPTGVTNIGSTTVTFNLSATTGYTVAGPSGTTVTVTPKDVVTANGVINTVPQIIK